LRDLEPELDAKGVRLVVIGLADLERARAFRDEHQIDFPVLVDAERRAYRAAGFTEANLLHIFRRDNFKWRSRAKSGGHCQTKLGANPMQLGGTLVIAPDERVLLEYPSKTFGDTASNELILSALAKL